MDVISQMWQFMVQSARQWVKSVFSPIFISIAQVLSCYNGRPRFSLSKLRERNTYIFSSLSLYKMTRFCLLYLEKQIQTVYYNSQLGTGYFLDVRFNLNLFLMLQCASKVQSRGIFRTNQLVADFSKCLINHDRENFPPQQLSHPQ